MHGRDQFIDIRDVRLRLCVAGTGPSLLLLHGWALDAAMWQPQFVGLTRCQLVAVDRRGFGFSSGEPDIACEVSDVLAILDTLAIQQTAIVGMSQGARVALRFAQRFPQRVGCLILDGPPHLATEMDELPMQHYRELVAAEGLESFRQQWLLHPLMQLHSGSQQAQSLLRDIVGRYPGRDLQHRSTAPQSPEPDISVIGSPALIINGEYDSATRRRAGDDLVRRLPDARHAVISGCGHLPNLDNPKAYNDLVLDFIHCHMVKKRAGSA